MRRVASLAFLALALGGWGWGLSPELQAGPSATEPVSFRGPGPMAGLSGGAKTFTYPVTTNVSNLTGNHASGIIPFDDTFLLWSRVPGRDRDEDFSSFPAQLALNFDASDEAIRASASLTLQAGTFSAYGASTWTGALADSAKAAFCRPNAAPFDPPCSGGASCVSAVSAQHPQGMILVVNPATAAERRYPAVVKGFGGCGVASGSNDLTVQLSEPVIPHAGDLLVDASDSTFIHPTADYQKWHAQLLLEKPGDLLVPAAGAELLAGGTMDAGCTAFADAGVGARPAVAVAFDPHNALIGGSSVQGSACSWTGNGVNPLSVRSVTVAIGSPRYYVAWGWAAIHQTSGNPVVRLYGSPSGTAFTCDTNPGCQVWVMATDELHKNAGTIDLGQLEGYSRVAVLIDKQALSLGADTAVKVAVDAGASAQVVLDEWHAYAKPNQDFAWDPVIPDGRLDLQVFGDSRALLLIQAIRYMMIDAPGAPLTRPKVVLGDRFSAISTSLSGVQAVQAAAFPTGQISPEVDPRPLVLVYFGVNDYAVIGFPTVVHQYGPSTVAANQLALWQRVEATGARVIAVVEPPQYGDALDSAMGTAPEGRICLKDGATVIHASDDVTQTINCARSAETQRRVEQGNGDFW